jgi:CheY-like chemotaxis protein
MTVDPDFRKQVKEALEHLYDTAYLATHPLLPQLTSATETSQLARAQKLRSILKEAIESIRPQHLGLPSATPEWRSYLALHHRYTQGMSQAQVESELGISLRQLQRELHKGLDAIALLLWEIRVTPEPSSNERMLTDVGEVQELRNEMEKWQLVREVCEVRSILDSVQWMLKPVLHDGLTISTTIPDSLSPVLVDSTLIRQALFQCLRLLIQSSTSGSIFVEAATQDSHVEIVMHGPTTAIDPALSDWQKARLLVERQGGVFSVDCGPNAKATVNLPQANPPLVLVVDDNPAIHDLFERYLAPHFYQVAHIHSGAEALDWAERNQPDTIILDVMMPTMDGWQVLRGLTENPQTKDIPIIICSVLKEPQLALSLGASAYLKKPADRLELLAILLRLQAESARGEADLQSRPSNNPTLQ